MKNRQPIIVNLNNVDYNLHMHPHDALIRSVIISLFTWRRARRDDDLPGDERMGWWGDAFLKTRNDKIGSRLWLLSRAKLTTVTLLQAQDYARESLQWLLDDKVANTVNVRAIRGGLYGLDLLVEIEQSEAQVDLRFNNFWDAIKNGISPTYFK